MRGDSDARAATAQLTVTGTFTEYLPVVMRRYSSTVPAVGGVVTVPVTIRSVHAAGQDHAVAYDPVGSGVFLDSPALVASLHTWDCDFLSPLKAGSIPRPQPVRV